MSIDQETVERAKKYAKKEGRSLSNLVESYLKLLSKRDESKRKELGPITRSLLGSLKSSKELDYKAIIKAAKVKKYG